MASSRKGPEAGPRPLAQTVYLTSPSGQAVILEAGTVPTREQAALIGEHAYYPPTGGTIPGPGDTSSVPLAQPSPRLGVMEVR